MPLDYSKWKSIEVSDDEDETHPNIDTLRFSVGVTRYVFHAWNLKVNRGNLEARLERMAEAKQARKNLRKKERIQHKDAGNRAEAE
uniref:Cdc37 N-terminal domain-containing protein n=1 Tax=Ditylenchus dipsaci TaxID=166011 RepID=A0A915DIV2_9BILA